MNKKELIRRDKCWENMASYEWHLQRTVPDNPIVVRDYLKWCLVLMGWGMAWWIELNVN